MATVAPTIDHVEETLSTLKFADRAKQVEYSLVKQQEPMKEDAVVVQKLQREIRELRELLRLKRRGDKLQMEVRLQ